MKNISEIESRLTDARINLTAALERGDGDTSPFRSAVVAIERELAAAQDEQANAERAQQRAEQQRLDAMAADAVTDVQNAVAAGAGASVVAGVEMPTPESDPAIATAASHLSYARERLAREDAVFGSHNGKYIALCGRLNDKERTRDAILARRVTGDEKPGDAAEVSLLAADIASLKELVSNARLNAEQYRPNTARRLVQEAESNLKRAQDMALLNVRKARVRALEVALIEEHSAAVDAIVSFGGSQFSMPMLRDLQRIVHRTSSWEDR